MEIKRKEGQRERAKSRIGEENKTRKKKKKKRKERRKKGKEEGNRNQHRSGSRTGQQRTRNCAMRGKFPPTPIILILGAT